MKNRAREMEDAWDGFGAGEYKYDEAAEKKYESSVWKYLAIASGLLLLFVIFMHGKELSVIWRGECVEAAYSVSENGSETAKYVDEEGKIHFYDITGLDAVHSEGTVKLYYIENINDAITKTKWTQWCKFYLFFAVLGGISGWRIYKIYKK